MMVQHQVERPVARLQRDYRQRLYSPPRPAQGRSPRQADYKQDIGFVVALLALTVGMVLGASL